MEQVDPQDVGLPLSPLPSVNVYRKEPNAFIYDEHSRECTMFHFGRPDNLVPALKQALFLLLSTL